MADDVESVTARLMQKIAAAPVPPVGGPAPAEANPEAEDPDGDGRRAEETPGDVLDPERAALRAAALAARAAALRMKPRPARAATPVWKMPGVGPMTPIPTMLGLMPAQALRERDLVRTIDGEFRPLVRVDRVILDEEFLSLHPEALPVLVRRDAYARGLPKTDLLLSPGQVVTPSRARHGEAATTALDLVGRPGVTRKAEAMFTYVILHVAMPTAIQIDAFRLSVGPLEATVDA